MRSTAADEREMRLDTELQALAAAKDWDGVLEALDQYDKNNNRRHKAHRDDMDVTVVDREPDDAGEFRYPAASLLKLSSPADWLDIIKTSFDKRSRSFMTLYYHNSFRLSILSW